MLIEFLTGAFLLFRARGYPSCPPAHHEVLRHLVAETILDQHEHSFSTRLLLPVAASSYALEISSTFLQYPFRSQNLSLSQDRSHPPHPPPRLLLCAPQLRHQTWASSSCPFALAKYHSHPQTRRLGHPHHFHHQRIAHVVHSALLHYPQKWNHPSYSSDSSSFSSKLCRYVSSPWPSPRPWHPCRDHSPIRFVSSSSPAHDRHRFRCVGSWMLSSCLARSYCSCYSSCSSSRLAHQRLVVGLLLTLYLALSRAAGALICQCHP
mmetsp:Transcript_21926/g.37827  ORF Transcript_21926/g.37827 Transcript_21926/m.37827 type:complete len:264 (+) Transcript_21926:967-1758(+)